MGNISRKTTTIRKNKKNARNNIFIKNHYNRILEFFGRFISRLDKAEKRIIEFKDFSKETSQPEMWIKKRKTNKKNKPSAKSEATAKRYNIYIIEIKGEREKRCRRNNFSNNSQKH